MRKAVAARTGADVRARRGARLGMAEVAGLRRRCRLGSTLRRREVWWLGGVRGGDAGHRTTCVLSTGVEHVFFFLFAHTVFHGNGVLTLHSTRCFHFFPSQMFEYTARRG